MRPIRLDFSLEELLGGEFLGGGGCFGRYTWLSL